MAAEQRIIGGGLLIFGIAIVLILLYVFTWGGASPEEGLDELRGTVYPAYVEAEAKADYLAVKARAKEALDLLEQHGRTAITKHLQGDAAGGDREAKRLYDLVSKGGFEKNALGLFPFGDGWYGSATHRALGDLEEAVDTRLRALKSIRTAARDATKAVADLQDGYGQELPLPPPAEVPEELVIVQPNPIYEADRELYRVFVLSDADVTTALNTPNPGGRATSARLRWNQNVAKSDLSRRIRGIPEQAEALVAAANAIRIACDALAKDADAAKARDQLLRRAATILGESLEGDRKAAFEEKRSLFESGDAIAHVLMYEGRMLEPYMTTIRDLGKAFGGEFVK